MKELDKLMSPSLKNRVLINKAIKPLLEQFDLSYFYCSQVSNKGDYSFFGNQMDWGEYYFKHEYLLEASEYFKPCNFKAGQNLTIFKEGDSFCPIRQVAIKNFEINHAIEIGYKDQKGIKFYGFAAKANTNRTTNFYLNELPLLQLFIKNFQKKNALIFNELHNHSISLSALIGPSFYEVDPPYISVDYQKFLSDLGIGLTPKLSKREIDISKYLIKGYSAGEIALDLNLSKRTIESYIENLKDKLSCFSKKELIQKCLELNSIDYFTF